MLDTLKTVHNILWMIFQFFFIIFWFLLVTPVIMINYTLYYTDMVSWNFLLYPMLFIVYFWLGISFWNDPE